jgi:hypothetical protein
VYFVPTVTERLVSLCVFSLRRFSFVKLTDGSEAPQELISLRVSDEGKTAGQHESIALSLPLSS